MPEYIVLMKQDYVSHGAEMHTDNKFCFMTIDNDDSETRQEIRVLTQEESLND